MKSGDLKGGLKLLYCMSALKRCEIRQRETYDCGPACLVSMAAYYGADFHFSTVRKSLCHGGRGARLSEMADFLSENGFESQGVRADVEKEDLNLFAGIPFPAIAYTENEGVSHYVVLYGRSGNSLIVMDPGAGVFKRVEKTEFFRIWKGILLLAIPSDLNLVKEKSRERNSGNTCNPSFFGRFAELVVPYRREVLSSFAGAVVYTLLGILQSVYLQQIVDRVLPDGNRNLVNLLSIGMLLAIVVSILISVLKSRMIAGVGMKIDMKLMMEYYRTVLSLPESYLNRIKSADLLARIADIVRVRTFFNEVLLSVAVNVTVVVFSVALMFSYYWKLGLVMLLSVPLYCLVYAVHSRLNAIAQKSVIESSAAFEGEVLGTIGSVREIRQLLLGVSRSERFKSRMVMMMDSLYTSFLNALSQGMSTELISRTFTVVVLWSGSVSVIDGEMTPGEMLSFYALMAYFISPVSSLIGLNRSYQDARISFERYNEVVEAAEEKVSGRVDLPSGLFGEISFLNVTFAYENRPLLFDALDLTIPSGRHVAFIGRSGCGKSTLTLLLQRFYRPSGGKITVSGVDLNTIEESCLRSNISAVSQNTVLFDDDFIGNIAVEDGHPDMAKVVDLCRRLDLYDFIMSLPDAFLTRLGENGVLLSGGQRQRLAVARAFYRSSRILILDEATSSADRAVESEVRKMIKEYVSSGNTVISIAHRYGVIRDADIIYVMDGGRIAECGTHDSLMDKNGLYTSILSR